MDLEQSIRDLLEQKKIAYQTVEHEPVYTNPAMAEALGVPESRTVKSLVVTTKEGELVVVVLPGHKKVDWKRAAAAANTRKVSFAKPETVLEKVGCEVGCVPPFGQRTSMKVIMDKELTRQQDVYFNPGVHHKSYKIAARDLVRLCKPSFMG